MEKQLEQLKKLAAANAPAKREDNGAAGGATGSKSEDSQSEESQKPAFEAKPPFTFTESGVAPRSGEGTCQLFSDHLVVLPNFGDLIQVPYRGISDLYGKGYRVNIQTFSGDLLFLGPLGRQYDDFLRIITRLRNELTLRDMLMGEKQLQPVARGQLSVADPESVPSAEGECELRLYETALVVLPDTSAVFRIPYSDIKSFSASDYRLEIGTEQGRRLAATQMGRLFDPFTKALTDASAGLQQMVAKTVSSLLPGADPSAVRKVARLMKEGRAARRADIDAISPSLWPLMEKRLGASGLMEEYSFLKGISQQSRICIGVKQGLKGADGSEYLWFMVPIYGRAGAGNAIAIEAASAEDTGRATYFFRIVGRSEYPSLGREALDSACDLILMEINRAMVDINFRREPVYLSDDKLLEPKYQHYFYAVKRLPSLKLLRSLFIGRVVHSSPEQWTEDVNALLEFNASSRSDAERWSKPMDGASGGTGGG